MSFLVMAAGEAAPTREFFIRLANRERVLDHGPAVSVLEHVVLQLGGVLGVRQPSPWPSRTNSIETSRRSQKYSVVKSSLEVSGSLPVSGLGLCSYLHCVALPRDGP